MTNFFHGGWGTGCDLHFLEFGKTINSISIPWVFPVIFAKHLEKWSIFQLPRTQMTLVLIEKGPYFGGLIFKNRAQLGSRYMSCVRIPPGSPPIFSSTASQDMKKFHQGSPPQFFAEVMRAYGNFQELLYLCTRLL